MLLGGMRELRSRLARWPSDWSGDELREMVDLACAEFEEFVEALDREARETHLLLPVDADGKVWHIGDEVDLDGYGHYEVVAVNARGIYYWNDCGEVEWTQAHTKRHWEPDTVESLLESLIRRIYDGAMALEDAKRLIPEYVDKLELKHV